MSASALSSNLASGRFAGPGLHALAIATFVAVLPVIFLGAEVTTKGVGMVDTASIREPWFMIAEWTRGELSEHGLGWVIEHGHRQFGWILGMLAIATAVTAFVGHAPGWLKGVAVACLVAIVIQGTLGIFRVQLDAILGKGLALIHGAFAQIVVALLLTQAVATTPSWAVGSVDASKMPALRTTVLLTLGCAFCQAVLGGLIRHQDSLLGGRLHVLNAFLAYSLVWIVIKFAKEAGYDSFRRLSRVLMALLTIQVLLGVEALFAWMKRAYLPEAIRESAGIQLVRSIHFVVGTLTIATLAIFAVKVCWAPRREALS